MKLNIKNIIVELFEETYTLLHKFKTKPKYVDLLIYPDNDYSTIDIYVMAHTQLGNVGMGVSLPRKHVNIDELVEIVGEVTDEVCELFKITVRVYIHEDLLIKAHA